ncbi:hypothetical protein [Absidia glauca]|uniref:Uncharacterized protein n=1 Tax=Absidia glauca TaxID=4829 RepID=A0A163JE56_ABSGL|nr:hypothetical protein [Absidia glauca]
MVTIATDPSHLEFGEESRPSPRPPSYKPDPHHRHLISLDLLERSPLCYHHHQSTKAPIWRHQFHGTPLVFWLMFFVLIGTISLFIPQLPPIALILWLPLLLYFIGILLVHGIYSRKACTLHQMTALQQHQQQQQQQQRNEYSDLYFLRSTSQQHSHAFTTLLPPPPSYQRATE